MPPKVKITKADIINTALALTREKGAESINARLVASRLQCSTQPIFTNFESIDQLKAAVIEKAYTLYHSFLDLEIQKKEHPTYKAYGVGYIRFAKEEKELFKLLFMRDRTDEDTTREDDLYNQMMSFVSDYTGLSYDRSRLFHLELWTSVHGIATMLATDYLDLSWDLISQITSDVYLGLTTRYQNKE